VFDKLQVASHRRLSTVCLTALLFVSYACHAQDDETKWSLTPFIGVNSPSLSQINNDVFSAPVQWSGNIVVQPSGTPQTEIVTIINPLPKIQYAAEGGVELGYNLDENNALVLGYSTWEGSSSSTTRTVLPFQGIFSQVFFQRTGTFSYNSFSIGWRHKLWEKNRKWRLSSLLGLRELYDIDYREDMVFLFQTGPAQSFKRIVSVNPQATGVAMLRLGLKGEYFPTHWLSIGLRGGYNIGFQDFSLNNASIKSDLQSNDNVGTILLPVRPGSDGKIQYLLSDGSGYRNLKVSMNGWDVMLGITLYH
jgi:hypothetical protein